MLRDHPHNLILLERLEGGEALLRDEVVELVPLDHETEGDQMGNGLLPLADGGDGFAVGADVQHQQFVGGQTVKGSSQPSAGPIIALGLGSVCFATLSLRASITRSHTDFH